MLNMQKIFLTILFLCWPLPGHAWMAKVVGVTDGDTIKVSNVGQQQIKIRLYGIDSPEDGQAYGQAAKKHLSALIAGDTVEIETVTKDRYGRTVGIVWDKETNINQEMVGAGYAWVYRKYCDRSFCSNWLILEEKAKKAKIGLWQEPEQTPPWEWRRRR